jgi:hypothetical protein
MAAGIAFGVALAGYWITLAPTVTLEYSGALVVAANHLGVARPPGFPVWTLLAKGFIELFPFASYQGHPNPAWAVNLMSAVFGALACGLLAWLVSRESKHLFADRPVSNPICTASGVVAALLFAFSPVMWSQSVIAETHALTNFYFLFLLALSLRWIAVRDERSPYPLAFLAGFGLSVSPLLMLFLPVLLLAAAFVSRKNFTHMAAAMAMFLGFLFAEFSWGPVRAGFDNGVPAIAILVATLGIGSGLAVFRLTRPTALLLVLLLAGLIPYIYLPLASDHNPPMNMGYARTWEGFWHVVSRGQYEAMVLSNPFADPVKFAHQLAWYFRLAASQFTAPLAALALVPLAGLPWLSSPARKSSMLLLAAFFCFALFVLICANPQLDVQNTFIARVIFIPSFALLAIGIGLGLATLLCAGSYFRTWTR